MQKQIYMVVCTDVNNGIAKNGKIPWSNKYELNFFKNLTTNTCNPTILKNAVIMGRKTADTLNAPLSNRINCVITRNLNYKMPNSNNSNEDCLNFNSIEKCLDELQSNDNINNIFLIGGNDIYNWGLSNSNKISAIYKSTILGDSYHCNLFFDNKFLLNHDFVLYTNSTPNLFNVNIININDNNGFCVNTYVKRENIEEKNYLNIMANLIKCDKRTTRNANTYSNFSNYLEFDLQKSFPLLTTKKMAIKSIFEELKFFLLGETNNQLLLNKNVHIWDANTTTDFINKCNLPYNEHDMGPMYGFQWRHFNAPYDNCNSDYTNKGVDQLLDVINLIKTDPFSRRILMTSYNPEQAKLGVLYPCHGISIQFYVREYNNHFLLDFLMHQRSADWFLGVPFNISSYALLVHFICNHINFTSKIHNKEIFPGKLNIIFGDTHIYDDHLYSVKLQLQREPFLFPKLNINYNICNFNKTGEGSIGEIEFKHINFTNYKSYDSIKAKMIA
jgi:dihydrofolate reductase/thymidylate synthase